jgi:hypothetical protein
VSALLALAFVASQEPDLSGEPALRQMLAAFGSATDFRAALVRYELDGPTDPGYEETFAVLDYRGSGVFRLHTTGSMGDGTVIVSDGKTWMTDSLSSFPVVLADAPEKFDQSRFDPRRGMGLLSWLLHGEPAMAALVKPGGAIRAIDGGVEFDAPFGKTRIWGTVAGKSPRLTKVEIEPGPTPGRFGPLPFVRDEYVRWETGPAFAKDTFSTKPPEGVPIQDDRKKAGG